MTFKFRHPFTAIIAGPTSCGKTYFTKKFIEHIHSLSDTKFSEIVWFYDEWQPLYKECNISIKFQQGLPDISEFSGVKPVLIIIDDLMRETGTSVVDIFTKGSHHRNLSVFYLTQNIFYQGKGQRDISLNANYMVYFKNPRDRTQITHLARQLYPDAPKFVREAYEDATERPHGYLLIDLKQDTPDQFRFITNILPEEAPSVVYIPKNKYKTHRQILSV